MSAVENNSLELVSSVIATSGDTEAFLSGMDTIDTYLLVFNNVADSDDGASLSIQPAYNGNEEPNSTFYLAGRQLKNGTNSNQSGTNVAGKLVNYGTTGSSYESNGHAYIYINKALKDGINDAYFRFTGFSVTYNDTDFISHDINMQFDVARFQANGLRLYANSGAWDSGEFRLYKLRSGT